MKPKIKGDFHFHSLHSGCQGSHVEGVVVDYNTACGAGAVSEMEKIGKLFEKAGYEYLAITNHASNPISTKPTGKEEADFFLEHIKQVKKFNNCKKCSLKFLAGAEVNIINQQGELSLPNKLLKELDVVVVSSHRDTKKLSRKDIRESFLNAIKNKHIDIVGHPTRHISKLKIEDWEEIICGMEKYNKVIEFNLRAPLGKTVLKFIAEKNLFISLGSDTHPEVITEEHFNARDYVKAYYKEAQETVKYLESFGIEPDRIINTFSLRKVRHFFKK